MFMSLYRMCLIFAHPHAVVSPILKPFPELSASGTSAARARMQIEYFIIGCLGSLRSSDCGKDASTDSIRVFSPRFMRLGSRVTLTATLLTASLVMPMIASAASFTDIPAESPILAAASYLQSKGIVQDGLTFNPDGKLTRAQAAKILVAPLVNAEDLLTLTTSSFKDVPAGQWYTAYAEAARKLGIVDSAANFNPNAPVTKAAFMKMLFVSKKLDYLGAFSDFKKPLSSDVMSANDWYYPVIRFALASSMTAVNADGNLMPSSELTRGSMALLYYRLDMYLAGRRTQALLSQAETDIGNVLQMLDQKHIEQAEYASARSVIAARGALAAKPEEGIVKGAMKVSEGFAFLVSSYRAGIEGRLDDSINAAKDAYNSAEKAKSFSAGLVTVVEQMEKIAKNMADQARTLKSQPAQ